MAVERPRDVKKFLRFLYICVRVFSVDVSLLDGHDIGISKLHTRHESRNEAVNPALRFSSKRLDDLNGTFPCLVWVRLAHVSHDCVNNLLLALESGMQGLLVKFEDDVIDNLQQSHLLSFVD